VVVNKPIHVSTIEEKIGPIWQPWRKIDLIQMENNKFMVQLFHRGDLERIIEGSPWLIDINMLILKKVIVGEDHVSIPMTKTDICVQVH
jgi:hypothetical protein